MLMENTQEGVFNSKTKHLSATPSSTLVNQTTEESSTVDTKKNSPEKCLKITMDIGNTGITVSSPEDLDSPLVQLILPPRTDNQNALRFSKAERTKNRTQCKKCKLIIESGDLKRGINMTRNGKTLLSSICMECSSSYLARYSFINFPQPTTYEVKNAERILNDWRNRRF